MICNKCGKTIPETLNYCPTCKILGEQNHQYISEDATYEEVKTNQIPYNQEILSSDNDSKGKLLLIIFILLLVTGLFALYFYFNQTKFQINNDSIIQLRCDLTNENESNKEILNYYIIDMEFENERILESIRVTTLSFANKDTYFASIKEPIYQGALFDDLNLTITIEENFQNYFKENKLTKYNEIITHFLDNGYKCDGKESKQVSIKTLYEERKISSPIIYKDRIYYEDDNKLFSVNFNGKDKIDLKVDNIQSLIYILDDFLYYKAANKYYRIDINNIKNIIEIGSELMPLQAALEKINYNHHLLITARIKDNKTPEYSLPIYYEDKIIMQKNNAIYLGDDIIYENLNSNNLVINEDYLYFVELLAEEKYRLVKYNINNNLLEKDIDLDIGIYNQLYDYNQNGIIYINAKKEFYKLEYNDFLLRKIEININDKDLTNGYISNLYYIQNNIIFEEKNNANAKAYLNIYNEITKEVQTYVDYLDYQVDNDGLFLIQKNGKIEKVLY